MSEVNRSHALVFNALCCRCSSALAKTNNSRRTKTVRKKKAGYIMCKHKKESLHKAMKTKFNLPAFLDFWS
jgi:phage terminase large subunit GpA-like protein